MVAKGYGLEVMVIDDQGAPGGQIWRSVELTDRRDDILGPSYVDGRKVAEAFRASGVTYQPNTQLWQVEPGYRAFVSRDKQAQVIEAKAILLATGAQERPVPFQGWTLPGVLTVGAAQILLKNAGQVPTEPVWIAASGPLPLLYTMQLLRAGGQVAGYIDTTPAGQWRDAIRHLPRALGAASELVKGLGWTLNLRAGKTQFIAGVTEIRALGDKRLKELQFRKGNGAFVTVKATTLLVHEGVVPNIHAALALDCKVEWNLSQDCFAPVLDGWGETSRSNIFIAGDGAGIGGAKAALLRGKIAALRIAQKLGFVAEGEDLTVATPLRRKLDRELAVRPFLDAMFRPRRQIFEPADDTIVCRCEEVTAGVVRKLALVGQPGPNQIKAVTRAGMGPCQGRQCGYSITRILAAAQRRAPADVGFVHFRPPLKPVTLGELASLDWDDAHLDRAEIPSDFE